MANHGHHTHALCLLTMLMSEKLCLSVSNQSLPSLRDPSLIWFVDQFDQRPSPDLTDSSSLQCRYSLVMSFPWHCAFLPRRRFVSGAFLCRRWFVRLSTGDCLLTQGYEGFIWVFDPGINRVLAEDEDVISLVETKKFSQAQWVAPVDLVSLFVFVEDEHYASDLSVSNRKTEKLRKLIRLIQREARYKTTGLMKGEFIVTNRRWGCDLPFLFTALSVTNALSFMGIGEIIVFAFMEFTQAALVVRRCSLAYSQGIRRPWYRMEKEAKSKIVQLTMIQKFWYHNVNISELIWKHQAYHAVSKHGVSAKKWYPRIIRIRARFCISSHYMAHKYAYVIIWFSKVLYTDFVNLS